MGKVLKDRDELGIKVQAVIEHNGTTGDGEKE